MQHYTWNPRVLIITDRTYDACQLFEIQLHSGPERGDF